MIAMAQRTLNVRELPPCTIEELLREVLQRGDTLTVRVSDGESVTITPATDPKPLPVLKGSVPRGWKNALYA